MYAYCISVYIYAVISKHISKDKDIHKRPPFLCGAGRAYIQMFAILPPALPRALFLYIAPLLVLLVVFLTLSCDI
jgi:hypothetical protein